MSFNFKLSVKEKLLKFLHASSKKIIFICLKKCPRGSSNVFSDLRTRLKRCHVTIFPNLTENENNFFRK